MNNQRGPQDPPDDQGSSVKRSSLFGVLSIVLGALGLFLLANYYGNVFYSFADGLVNAIDIATALVATTMLIGVAALVAALVGLHRGKRRWCPFSVLSLACQFWR